MPSESAQAKHKLGSQAAVTEIRPVPTSSKQEQKMTPEGVWKQELLVVHLSK